MCVETVLEAQREFQKENILKPEGKIVVTHFSHNSKLLHDEFVRIFNPVGIVPAYDGLIINI
nr:hypothetical protein [Paenibacillus ihbetae]